MESLLKSDIFFLITSASVILIAIAMLVLLGYVLRIAKNIKDMTDIAKSGTEGFFKHISGLGENIKKEGTKTAKNIEALIESKIPKKRATKRASKKGK